MLCATSRKQKLQKIILNSDLFRTKNTEYLREVWHFKNMLQIVKTLASGTKNNARLIKSLQYRSTRITTAKSYQNMRYIN